MPPGDYLETAVQREPLTGHVGKSGAVLERVLLEDGRRLVVKHLEPATDLVMTVADDRDCRELRHWQDGLLDRLPDGVGHAVVDGWRTGTGATLVMRDLGAGVLSWEDRLDEHRWHFLVDRLGRLHRAFLGSAPAALVPLESTLGLFAPDRLAPYVDDANPLPGLVIRGWRLFAGRVPADVSAPVFELLARPERLAKALAARPCTLVHGDLTTVNVAIEDDRIVLLDWSLACSAPGALDLARFLAGCASVVDVSREQMIEDYRLAAGPAFDNDAMDLAILGGLLWLGWNKALDAAEHPEAWMRDREREDLDWWVRRARSALAAGLL
jgi:hypothetical protein